MLYKKTGFPEESELVICTVTRIQYNSVFVKLDEYNLQGMIHIAEISPGRIRNIRDYVKEGKVVVCVVLRINRERGHIDLSLRRVNEGQRRKKLEKLKLEQKAEKIIEFVAKSENADFKGMYKKVMDAISDEYETLSDFFEDFIAGNVKIDKSGLKSETLKLLEETVRQRIKPPSVEIKGTISLQVLESNGIEIIKKTLTEVEKLDKDLSITYLGAGKYEIRVVAPDFKIAEKQVKNTNDVFEKRLKKVNAVFSFKRKN